MADESPPDPSVAAPIRISLVLLLVAILLGVALSSRILGAVVAVIALIPAGIAAWLGLQARTTQTRLLAGMLVMFLCLGVAALMILLRVFD